MGERILIVDDAPQIDAHGLRRSLPTRSCDSISAHRSYENQFIGGTLEEK
jgi:hypothetical protein